MDDASSDLLSEIEAEIVERARGVERIQREFGLRIRSEIDRVIDGNFTGRLVFDELEKTEKTYIGTRLEIALRAFLQLPRGSKLDLLVGDHEVDVKTTTGKTWTIPPEAENHACVLIRADEGAARFDLGLAFITDDLLNKGRNRDGKRTISAKNLGSIHWIVRSERYPQNFFETLEPATRQSILAPATATQRLVELFTLCTQLPVSREAVEVLAGQKDSMKRLRKNGGARDFLESRGIALLSGRANRVLIEELGLPQCTESEFISMRPEHETQRRLLHQHGFEVR